MISNTLSEIGSSGQVTKVALDETARRRLCHKGEDTTMDKRAAVEALMRRIGSLRVPADLETALVRFRNRRPVGIQLNPKVYTPPPEFDEFMRQRQEAKAAVEGIGRPSDPERVPVVANTSHRN